MYQGRISLCSTWLGWDDRQDGMEGFELEDIKSQSLHHDHGDNHPSAASGGLHTPFFNPHSSFRRRISKVVSNHLGISFLISISVLFGGSVVWSFVCCLIGVRYKEKPSYDLNSFRDAIHPLMTITITPLILIVPS